MKGYKCFESDMTCRGYQYEVGKTYKHEGEIQLCASGFHFCRNPMYLFDFYRYLPDIVRVCEVEALGRIETSQAGGQSVTDKIKIIRELTWEEVREITKPFPLD